MQAAPSDREHGASGPLNALMSICGWVAAGLFGCMALLVAADITIRLAGLGNLPWSNEVTEYMITVATFVGAPWVLHHHGHVNVDVAVMQLSDKYRRLVGIFANIVCLFISAVMLYESISVLLDTRESNALVFKALVFPEWYLIIPPVICFLLFTFEFAARLFKGEVRS
jgi:TRAP-type C4-dicarboxylate transport system permease small subunit